jgi:hypothetical protein
MSRILISPHGALVLLTMPRRSPRSHYAAREAGVRTGTHGKMHHGYEVLSVKDARGWLPGHRTARLGTEKNHPSSDGTAQHR